MTNAKEINMNGFFKIPLLILTAVLLSNLWAVTGEWEKVFEKSNIVVNRKSVPGSPLVIFQGKGRLQATANEIIAVMYDTDSWPEWVHNNLGTHIISNLSKTEKMFYSATKSPSALIADREYVARAWLEEDKAAHSITVKVKNLGMSDLDALGTNIPHFPKRVRMPRVEIDWTLNPIRGSSETDLVITISADPGGLIPKWIVNSVSKNIPFNSLLSLRKRLAGIGARQEFREQFKNYAEWHK
ncbi:MAG: hypothetical protein JNM63_07565 [Spirochaetia bacterium]|nr:hypothetical protein [Spirochaetia bacterium]